MWISVKFGNNNVVLISPYLCQIVDPAHFLEANIDANKFKAVAIKSRVHFRRGFFDNGWARTILLVEPVEPFLGTTRLEGLPRKNNDVKKFYPFNLTAKYP
jgi:microcystin degradation protein MlrC